MNIRQILAISIASFLVQCSLVSKKQPEPANATAKAELNKVEIDINTGNTKKAVQRLKRIISTYGKTDAADDASIYLGQIYYKASEYEAAYNAFIFVINSEYYSPRETDASVGAAKSLDKLQRYDEALSMASRALKASNISPETQIELFSLRYSIQTQLGDRLDALRSLIQLAQLTPNNALKEKYQIKANEYVESTLKDDELDTVAKDSSFGFVRPQALYRVAMQRFEQRDYTRAESFFENVRSLAPQSDIAISAENYLEQISSRRRVEPYTIGAVLPLSGKHAQIANRTLRGLELGLGITGESNAGFKLAVIDSEANPDLARRAVERLVIEDSVIAIVGDLLSKTAEPVAQKASDLGVPIIGLSQKSGLTQVGDGVFRNALTSEAIVKELVQNAIEKYGMKKFAILYPNDAYGTEYANLFWDEVLEHGGQIVGAQTYSSEEKDFHSAIARLVGTFYVDDRSSEYSYIVKDWYDQQKTITSRVSPPSDLLSPIIDFDAIFIPDGVKALGQIASMLLYNDVKNVRLLGTNLWNNPGVVERGTSLIENSLFIDAKSVVDNSLTKTNFYKEYKKIYNEEPSLFEAQAYDTGLVLKNLIASGARTRVDLKSKLSEVNHFRGSVGDIDVSTEREFSRPLAILTVKDGKIIPAAEPLPQGKN